MGLWIKDRSPASLLNGIYGLGKPREYGFPSLEAMTLSEVEIMQKARELYPYIPEVINYDRETQQLTMTKIEGEHIDVYIKRTKDLSIIDNLKDVVKQLRSREISLNHRYENYYKPDEISFDDRQYRKGYIVYHDYHAANFIVDRDRNIWLIDWDTAGVYPEEKLSDDDFWIDDFCEELGYLLNPPVLYTKNDLGE